VNDLLNHLPTIRVRVLRSCDIVSSTVHGLDGHVVSINFLLSVAELRVVSIRSSRKDSSVGLL
jgi:hypothetical protein